MRRRQASEHAKPGMKLTRVSLRPCRPRLIVLSSTCRTVESRVDSMPIRKLCRSLCILLLFAGCGVGNANGERVQPGGPAASPGSVTVFRYCEDFAREYAASNAIGYTDLVIRTGKKPDIMMWLSNMFQPSDSRFVAGYDCHFTARSGDGQVRTASVGIFLTETLDFAHYTKWKNLQIIPIGHVVDETHGRAGYGVFKYLKTP